MWNVFYKCEFKDPHQNCNQKPFVLLWPIYVVFPMKITKRCSTTILHNSSYHLIIMPRRQQMQLIMKGRFQNRYLHIVCYTQLLFFVIHTRMFIWSIHKFVGFETGLMIECLGLYLLRTYGSLYFIISDLFSVILVHWKKLQKSHDFILCTIRVQSCR